MQNFDFNSFYSFIDSCVDFESEKENTIKNASNQLFDEVVKWDKRNIPQYKKFTEALQGLPSYINIPFMNYEIFKLMYSLGAEANENNDDEYFKVCEIYWDMCGQYLKTNLI